MLCRGVDFLEIGHVLVMAVVLGLLRHHLGVADDGVERRPELVAHGGEELALGRVRGLGRDLRLLELLFLALAGRDVLGHRDHARGLAFRVLEHAGGEGHGNLAPVLRLVDGLERGLRGLRFQRLVRHAAADDRERLIHELGLRVSQEPEQGAVHRPDLLGTVDHDEGVLHVADDVVDIGLRDRGGVEARGHGLEGPGELGHFVVAHGLDGPARREIALRHFARCLGQRADGRNDAARQGDQEHHDADQGQGGDGAGLGGAGVQQGNGGVEGGLEGRSSGFHQEVQAGVQCVAKIRHPAGELTDFFRVQAGEASPPLLIAADREFGQFEGHGLILLEALPQGADLLFSARDRNLLDVVQMSDENLARLRGAVEEIGFAGAHHLFDHPREVLERIVGRGDLLVFGEGAVLEVDEIDRDPPPRVHEQADEDSHRNDEARQEQSELEGEREARHRWFLGLSARPSC